MGDEASEATIRRAIGGSSKAVEWLRAHASTTDDPQMVVMAGVLDGRADRLDRAEAIASTVRDRQIVAIARAYQVGNVRLVDALARDHLVDHPDSLIVAWIATKALQLRPGGQA